MNSPDQNPKLPTWIFVATDAALVAAAAFIAWRSHHPLSPGTMLAIVGCLGLGALILLVPLVARFERQKNALLDDRQNALEALARTVAASAEQISIAAGGLHEIAELAQKNLRHAEQLPHKLQDKIAEFQAQLTTAADTEKEELERELLALRTTESERLETVSQRIAKSAAEWTKLEAATQQHLTAANEAVAKLSFGTASAIGKAQVAAEQALSQARIEAARVVGEASGTATREIEAAKTAALAELETKLSTATATIVAQFARELNAHVTAATHALDEKTSRLEAAARQSGAAHAAEPSATPTPAAATSSESAAPAAADAPGGYASTSDDAALQHTPVAQPPKRPRKARREEPVASESPAEPAVVAPATDSAGATPASRAPSTAVTPATTDAAPTPTENSNDEPAPIPAEKIAQITPVAPHTAEPFPREAATPAASTADSTPPAVAPPPASESAAPAPRKRAPKKPEADDEPGLGLDLGDSSGASPTGVMERVLTSDGATRLLVTAYIGIGNRLFIRGDGPGLSWEKGVPLQFISIGKWRWETNDASGPLQFKLYKNDDLECAALGAQSLDPGHQQEVTAAF